MGDPAYQRDPANLIALIIFVMDLVAMVTDAGTIIHVATACW